MSGEVMDLEQLARFLRRDVREVSKLASRGHLPGQKVGGQWRFHKAEINHWVETQLPSYSDDQLTALESPPGRDTDSQLLLAPLLSEATTAVPLPASTRTSVLRELVSLAEHSWQVFDGEALLQAVRQREDLGSTGLAQGVAIPHPRRPLPSILGEDVIALGHTVNGIPFGGDGGLVDVFFLVCCRDYRTHLQVLARLSRLIRRPGFLEQLRASGSPAEALEVVLGHERDLVSGG